MFAKTDSAETENKIDWLMDFEPHSNRLGGSKIYRQEVKKHGLIDAVEQMRRGITPPRFPWLKKVIDFELDSKKVSVPYRLAAVIEELVKAEVCVVRDIAYEHQVESIGRVLSDVQDENLNFMGFCTRFQTTDGKTHEALYGVFTLGEEEKWYANANFGNLHIPLANIQAVVPWRSK